MSMRLVHTESNCFRYEWRRQVAAGLRGREIAPWLRYRSFECSRRPSPCPRDDDTNRLLRPAPTFDPALDRWPGDAERFTDRVARCAGSVQGARRRNGVVRVTGAVVRSSDRIAARCARSEVQMQIHLLMSARFDLGGPSFAGSAAHSDHFDHLCLIEVLGPIALCVFSCARRPR